MQAFLDKHNNTNPEKAIVGLNDDDMLAIIYGLRNAVEAAFQN
jgi:hypothetical protein